MQKMIRLLRKELKSTKEKKIIKERESRRVIKSVLEKEQYLTT